jgi:PST family polysaccharide transporter
LGPENLGIYTILYNLQGIVVLLAVFGIPSATVKFVAEFNIKDREIVEKIISTSFFLVLVITFFVSFIYFSTANFIAIRLYSEPILIVLIMVSSVTVVFTSIFSLFQSILQGLHKIEILSKLNILNSFISFPIIVYLAYSYGLLGAVVGALTYAIIRMVINFGFTYKVLKEKKVKFQFNIDKKVAKKLLNYGLPAFLSIIVVMPAFWFANTILALKSGFGQVGLFGVAQSLSSLLMFIPSAIAIPLVPIISELHVVRPTEMSNIVSKIFKLIMLLLLPFTVTLCLFSKIIVSVIYGPAFYGAWHILFFMSIAVFLIAINSVIGNVLSGTGKMWEAFGINLIWMIFFVSSSYYFINIYGLIGLGFAYVLSYLIYNVVVYSYTQRKLHVKFKNKEIAGILLLASVAFLASYFILISMEGSIFYLSSIGVILFLVAIEHRLLTKEDKKTVVNLFKGVKE